MVSHTIIYWFTGVSVIWLMETLVWLKSFPNCALAQEHTNLCMVMFSRSEKHKINLWTIRTDKTIQSISNLGFHLAKGYARKNISKYVIFKCKINYSHSGLLGQLQDKISGSFQNTVYNLHASHPSLICVIISWCLNLRASSYCLTCLCILRAKA